MMIEMRIITDHPLFNSFFHLDLASSLVDNTTHLHWLTIVGITSFISTIYKLIPVDNSIGSKLTGSVLSRDGYSAFNVILGFFKFIFIILMIFNVGGFASSSLLNKQKILLDYFIVSQLVYNDKVRSC